MVSTPRHRTVLAEYACGILHDLKTDLKLSSMSLENRQGAYASLGIKVMSYLFRTYAFLNIIEGLESCCRM